MAHDSQKPKRGVTRRKFLEYSAGTSLLLSASPLLRPPGSAQAASPKKAHLEMRTYLFNLLRS